MNTFNRDMSLSDLKKILEAAINKRSEGSQKNSCHVGGNLSEIDGKSSVGRLEVYGRICTTKDAETPPVNLSDVPGRKTAFLFGHDTVCGALHENIHDPYKMLLRLGFIPEYIHLKACKLKACYWLVLLAPNASSLLPTSTQTLHPALVNPVPATWDGLLSFLRACYPDSLPAVRAHWSSLTTKPVGYFESKSPVKFIQAVKDPGSPDFMSYGKFRALPSPQEDWETRLFLYCEVRIFELFSGDGHTWSEAGVKGEKEYLSPNYSFEKDLGRDNFFFIPLTVTIPPEVKEKFDE